MSGDTAIPKKGTWTTGWRFSIRFKDGTELPIDRDHYGDGDRVIIPPALAFPAMKHGVVVRTEDTYMESESTGRVYPSGKLTYEVTRGSAGVVVDSRSGTGGGPHKMPNAMTTIIRPSSHRRTTEVKLTSPHGSRTVVFPRGTRRNWKSDLVLHATIIWGGAQILDTKLVYEFVHWTVALFR